MNKFLLSILICMSTFSCSSTTNKLVNREIANNKEKDFHYRFTTLRSAERFRDKIGTQLEKSYKLGHCELTHEEVEIRDPKPSFYDHTNFYRVCMKVKVVNLDASWDDYRNDLRLCDKKLLLFMKDEKLANQLKGRKHRFRTNTSRLFNWGTSIGHYEIDLKNGQLRRYKNRVGRTKTVCK